MSKTETAGAAGTQPRPSYGRALLWYRIMAYTTGVVLTVATVMLILQKVVDVHGIDTPTGLLWFFHGYLFLVYAAVTLYLGLKLRWSLTRIGLTAACGTIPLMSFVAERYVHRHVRADAAELVRRG